MHGHVRAHTWTDNALSQMKDKWEMSIMNENKGQALTRLELTTLNHNLTSYQLGHGK